MGKTSEINGVDVGDGNMILGDYGSRKWKAYKDNHSYNAEFDNYKECVLFIKENGLVGYIPELGWGYGMGRYHKRWGWLMEIVAQITSETFEVEENGHGVHFTTFGMTNDDGEIMVRISRHALFCAPTLIEATWLACVDYCRIKKNQASELSTTPA